MAARFLVAALLALPFVRSYVLYRPEYLKSIEEQPGKSLVSQTFIPVITLQKDASEIPALENRMHLPISASGFGALPYQMSSYQNSFYYRPLAAKDMSTVENGVPKMEPERLAYQNQQVPKGMTQPAYSAHPPSTAQNNDVMLLDVIPSEVPEFVGEVNKPNGQTNQWSSQASYSNPSGVNMETEQNGSVVKKQISDGRVSYLGGTGTIWNTPQVANLHAEKIGQHLLSHGAATANIPLMHN